MSSDRSRLTPESAERLEKEAFARLDGLVRRARPGAALDPLVVAREAGLPLGQTLALLQALSHQGQGRLELRVVDRAGREVGRYANIRDVPASITDRFGERTRIYPEQVELVFRVSS